MNTETKIAIGVVTGLVAGTMATSALFVVPAALRGFAGGGPGFARGGMMQRGQAEDRGWNGSESGGRGGGGMMQRGGQGCQDCPYTDGQQGPGGPGVPPGIDGAPGEALPQQ